MGAVFSYSLYSSILLSLLYLSYKWALAGENQHVYNRTALWLIYAVALLALPVMNSASSLWTSAPGVIPEIELGEMEMTFIADEVSARQPVWLTWLLWTYFAGIVLAVVHTLWIVCRLGHIVSSGEIVSEGRFKVVLTDDTTIAPFSWWRYVVMSRRDWEESSGMILTHELQHLGLRHWIDLLVAQLVGIFQWYNPAAWLMREELKTVHEYQADKAVLASGVPVRDYQKLLIKRLLARDSRHLPTA